MRRAESGIEAVIVLAIIAIIMAIVTPSCRGCATAAPDGKVNGDEPSYSTGIRVGTITKFSLKGIKYKSWEGELNLGGYVSDGNNGQRMNIWRFSCLDEEIANKIEKAAMQGGPVSLHYKQYGFWHPINIDTDYLIDGVVMR